MERDIQVMLEEKQNCERLMMKEKNLDKLEDLQVWYQAILYDIREMMKK